MVFTDTLQDPRSIPPHWHEAATISLTLDGRYSESHGSTNHLCGPGSVVVKPPGCVHSNEYERRTRSVIVELDFGLTARYGVGAVINQPRNFRDLSLLESGRRIVHELERQDGVSSLVLTALVLEALAVMARRRDRGVSAPSPSFLRAVELIHDRSHEALGLSQIAVEVGIAPQRLVGEFRRHLDTTVGEYQREVRVERARMALSETDVPIARIALDVGFSDQSHLTRVFQAKVGMTPARYRTAVRGRETTVSAPIGR